MCPFEMAFFTWLYAVSSHVVRCADGLVRDAEECSIKCTTPYHWSSTGYTLLKRIGMSLRGMWPETLVYGVVGVFVMILGVTWFLCGLPHRDLIFSLLPLLGGQTCFSSFLRVKEF